MVEAHMLKGSAFSVLSSINYLATNKRQWLPWL